MKRIVIVTISFWLCWSCTKEEFFGPGSSGYDVVEIATQPVTRGTPISEESQMTDMGVFCAYTGTSDWTPSDVPQKMVNRKLTYTAGTPGSWVYEGTPEKWNSASAHDRYTFFAYAPFARAEHGMAIHETAAGVPTLTYTVPADVTAQPDLMVGVPRKNMRPTNTPVIFQMQHALTCVGFQIAGDGNKIAGIAIRGVSMTGTLSMDGETIFWSDLGPVNTTTDFTASLNTDPGQSYYTATPTMSTDLMKGDGYLMMIPQELGPHARIIITEADGNEIEIGLDAKEWLAGRQVNYKISIVPGGTITVTPDNLLLPWFGVNQYTDNIEVMCYDTQGNPSEKLEWTLTTDDAWFSMTLNEDGSAAGSTVSGKGTKTVYTLATENTSNTDDRFTTVYLNDESSDVRVNVRQVYKPDPGLIHAAGDTLPNRYVGAFWHRNYTGERIIKIDLDEDPQYLGKWSASVVWWDGRWKESDFVVAAGGSSDPNIYTDNPGFCENYKVTSPAEDVKAYAASGTVDGNGSILFRIGLNTAFDETHPLYDFENQPARYAVLIISYNDYSRHQKVFLRQGHERDYLIHPSERSAVGVKRFTTRNLSTNNVAEDPKFDKDFVRVYKRGTTTEGTSASRFANYPSQAGLYFQWGVEDGTSRRGYHPSRNVTANWYVNNYSNSNTWTAIAATNETCPNGYRRPRYSRTELSSEPLQSLCADLTKPAEHTVYGYYADGFFDRRIITKSQNGWEKTAVVPNTVHVGYAGRLVFNPTQGSQRENASIFFPIAGRIDRDSGRLTSTGRAGHYWLSTSVSATDPEEDPSRWFAYNLGVGPYSFEPRTYSYRGHAFPIRCVGE